MPSISIGSGAEAALREGGRTIRWSAVCWLLLLVLLPACGLSAPSRTARKPVTNDYSGVQVTEDYQWLEDAGDPPLREWTATQNDAAREFLDKLPTRTAVEYQLRRLFSAAGADYTSLRVSHGRVFALKQRPLDLQPVLVAFSSLTNLHPQITVLDPNTPEKT